MNSCSIIEFGRVGRPTPFMAIVFSLMLLASSGACAAEMIKNGGFEDSSCKPGSGVGCTSWDFSGNAAVNNDGHLSEKGATVGGLGDGPGRATQKLMLTPGNYIFSFWYKPASGTAGVTPAIVRIAGKTVFAKMLKLEPTTWNKCEIFLIVDSGGEKTIEFSSETAPSFAGPLFQIDDVSLTN
jgi:hypothetical protein